MAVENETGRVAVISRPHFPGTKFGLLVLRTAQRRELEEWFEGRSVNPTLFAETTEPPIPRVLRSGARWSGRLTGRGRIPADRYVRVTAGRFTIDPPVDGLPDRFTIVSRNSVRLGG